MENWQKYRDIFPHVKQCVYMNHAAVSPLQKYSVGAMQQYFYQRSSEYVEYWTEALEAKEKFKNLIGQMIRVPADNVALTSNTSMGLNWLAQGLEWKPGDRILLNNYEFPSNVYPFMNLQRQGVEIDFVKHRNGCIEIEDIIEKITPQTCLLSISYVEFLNGYKNDLKRIGEICREHNIIFCVDGIQGIGVMDINAQECGIDFLSCGGHKWLMWPMGTAFFYLSPRIFDQVSPMAVGWLSVEDPWDVFSYEAKLQKTAQRFEPGVFNVTGIIGANAAMEVFLEIGIPNIENRILDTTDYLIERLQEQGLFLHTSLDREHRSGIVTFQHKQADDLMEHLTKNNIFVSLRDGVVRIAPHFYNTKAEVDLLMDEIIHFDSASVRERKKLVV